MKKKASKPRPKARPPTAPRAAAPAAQSWPGLEPDIDFSDDDARRVGRPIPSPVLPPQRRMIPMRRVWDRIGSIEAPPRSWPDVARKARLEAERRADEQELSRKALKQWYVLAFRAGDLSQAEQVVERWLQKDPLDPDVLTARADLAAQRGDRELAIRMLGSVVDVRPGDHKAQWRLARLHRWAGRPERGCRHSLAVAQIKLRDEKLVAEAVECARAVGKNHWADDLLGALDAQQRRAVERVRTRGKQPGDELSGDLRLEASWQGARHDLDLVIVHPDGFRVSWLGAPTRSVISARDVRSVQGEGLSLRGAKPGQYALELVRNSGGAEPVSGSVKLLVGKAQRTVPFVLEGERLRFATARIRMKSRLVPYDGTSVRR